MKFNYRSIEARPIDYYSAYEAVLLAKNTKTPDRILRGSMHVSDLWSENNMQEVIGSLPFPKDRLKILNSYKRGKDLRIKIIPKKQKENRLSILWLYFITFFIKAIIFKKGFEWLDWGLWHLLWINFIYKSGFKIKSSQCESVSRRVV